MAMMPLFMTTSLTRCPRFCSVSASCFAGVLRLTSITPLGDPRKLGALLASARSVHILDRGCAIDACTLRYDDDRRESASWLKAGSRGVG